MAKTISSAPDLLYPITVVTLHKRSGDTVKRGDALLEYSYKSKAEETDDFTRESKIVERAGFGTVPSNVDGTLHSWHVDIGTKISGPSTALVDIEEECSHSVQYGGLCTNCGKDMTTVDFTDDVPDTIRANTTVTPNHQALRISDQEAALSDEAAKKRLLSNRKLSLVVDLDLTVIHASVDPTIREWMDDEHNPNHPAVKDVRVFDLYDEALGRNVSYYIKLRPNLNNFLEAMALRYELYIYTMGTRAYAENIAKLVDPTRKFFGQRILSRTETPGEVSKNLRKLFPVDNRMVVIIDDRADVWNWSNYLVRVKPFNFFVGIGDINSSFLPKQDDASKTVTIPTPPETPTDSAINDTPVDKEEDQQPQEGQVGPIKLQRSPTSQGSGLDGETDDVDGDESALGQIVSMQEGSDAMDIERKTKEQDDNLAQQLSERPLLQLQKKLEEEQEEALNSTEEAEEDLNGSLTVPDGGENGVSMERTRSASRLSIPQTLLKDDDRELHDIENILSKIQNMFYNQFDQAMEEHDLEPNEPDPKLIPDVKDVIEQNRRLPLKGCRVAFSRLVPRHVDIMRTRWADMAMRLGAVVQGDISYHSNYRDDTTHLVCRPGDPTDKMKEAAVFNVKKRKRGEQEIAIVNPEWMTDSASSWWQKVDETPYMVYVDPPRKRRRSSGTADDGGFSDAGGQSAEVSEAEEDGDDIAEQEATFGNDFDDDDDRPKSPEEEEAEWAAAFASDEEDEEFSDSAEEDDDADASHVTVKVNGSRPRKRRREDDSDRDSESDGSSVSSSQRSTKDASRGFGSDLQRRKKRALERTSSLTQVANADGTEETITQSQSVADEESEDDGMEAAMMEALGEVNGEDD